MKNSLEIKQEKSHRENNEIVLWDAFLLGEHVLLCSDASSAELVSKILTDRHIEVIITDPPYGIDYVASKVWFNDCTEAHQDITNDWYQTDEKYIDFTESWLRPVIPYLSEKNASYIFNADKMIFALREWMKKVWWKFSQLLIWIKESAVIWRLDYLPQHELIAYGWYKRHAYYWVKSKSVLVFPKTRKNTIHPTMKPIPLLRELILNSSKQGDTVYDPFGWSGSTLIACEQTHRKCVTIELNPVYCSRIVKRWENLTWKQVQKFNFL